jgi:hypothetical protein
MDDHNDIKLWLDNLQAKLNKTQYTMRREQVLMELLVKITHLMKTGNFKEAAFLRAEFERIKAGHPTEQGQFFG